MGHGIKGMKIVATNGCFDIIHAGHVQFLNEAKQLGDKLIVGLNSDKSVKKLKGDSRPYNTEQNRAEVLLALESVDQVIIFDSIDCRGFLKGVRPDIYVKGGDYTIDTLPECEKETIFSVCKEIKILKKYDSLSTSQIIEKLQLTDK
tara:strand:+ start:641 stop:1081 length:441 start_codon:yes stop_codon:yes gene_type:complete